MPVTKYYCNGCHRSWTVGHTWLFWGKCEWCSSRDVVEVDASTPLDRGPKYLDLQIEDVVYVMGAEEV